MWKESKDGGWIGVTGVTPSNFLFTGGYSHEKQGDD